MVPFEPPYETILKGRLTPTHLALARGWVQGLELADIAPRYLAGLGADDSAIDLRNAKTSLMWVLNDLANTARRAGLKGSGVLTRQAKRIRVDPDTPSLEDFADTLDDADFYSEKELLELCSEAHGNTNKAGTRSLARRSRLIERQLALLTDITHYLAAPISLGDQIELWFENSIAQRLESSGLVTLEDLAIQIVGKPADWHAAIRGIGDGKALRIERFLTFHFGALDDALARAGIHIPRQLESDGSNTFRNLLALPSPARSSSELVGLNLGVTDDCEVIEPYIARSSLDGSVGRLRGNTDRSATYAKTDVEALETWLGLKNSDKTVLLYRREMERLIMWSTGIKGIPISSLTIEDALDYRDFLAAVPDAWIGKKGTPTNVSEWRPFAGSLTPRSISKALVIIKGFYKWAVGINYCTANPFASVKIKSALPASTSTHASDEASLIQARDTARTILDRTLPYSARQAVEAELSAAVHDQFLIRARFIFNLAILGGLRISEIAAARRQHLTYVEPSVRHSGGWELKVVGKFNKARVVPLPDSVIQDLCKHLNDRSLGPSLNEVDPGVFLVGCSPSHMERTKSTDPAEKHKKPGDGVTPFAIHRAVKKLFLRALNRADLKNPDARNKLLEASMHWLRHTFGTDATEDGVPIEVLRDVLGHSNISTTSLYVHTSLERSREQLNKYWNRREASGSLEN